MRTDVSIDSACMRASAWALSITKSRPQKPLYGQVRKTHIPAQRGVYNMPMIAALASLDVCVSLLWYFPKDPVEIKSAISIPLSIMSMNQQLSGGGQSEREETCPELQRTRVFPKKSPGSSRRVSSVEDSPDFNILFWFCFNFAHSCVTFILYYNHTHNNNLSSHIWMRLLFPTETQRVKGKMKRSPWEISGTWIVRRNLHQNLTFCQPV